MDDRLVVETYLKYMITPKEIMKKCSEDKVLILILASIVLTVKNLSSSFAYNATCSLKAGSAISIMSVGSIMSFPIIMMPRGAVRCERSG